MPIKNPLNYDKNIDVFVAECKKDAPNKSVIKKQLTIAVLKSMAKGALIGLAIGGSIVLVASVLTAEADGVIED